MTSPREQAIEEAAKAAFLAFADDTSTMRGLWESDASTREEFTKQTRAAIDAYESARARIDGAKMMPREATEVRADGGCLHCTADQGESHRPGCPRGG